MSAAKPNNPSSAEAGAFFIAALAIAQAVWIISFNLGAYGDVFFEHLFMIWAASIAALLARLFIGKTSDGESYFGWPGTLLLMAPTLWIATEVLTLGNTSAGVQWFRFILTLLTLTVALPYIGYVIINTALPEVAEIHHPRLRSGLLVITLLTTGLAYLVGAKNYYVMSCHEFEIAGASLPENCYRGQVD
ncbi:MAG: hypothetical protein ACPGVP_14625 [Thiolinea sp.]